MLISTSILQVNDKVAVNKINKTTTDYIHLDIMDGKFVNNKTNDINYFIMMLENIDKKVDVHLMVDNPLDYVDEYSIIMPEYITFHIESNDDINETIDYIKEKDVKVGLALNPSSDINLIKPYLNSIDLVLIMSVEPGMGGQQFMNSTINKLSELKMIRKVNNYNFKIEVDGGINDQTINLIKKADIAVVGSFITNSNNYQEQINKL